MTPCRDHGLSGNKPGGYHQVRRGGKLYYVHRIAYAVHHNLLIEDVPPLLRHSCDNPRCIEPEHLLPGTHTDNAADRVTRGRSAKANPGRRVMTPEQDREIARRRAGKPKYARENSLSRLAVEFGVSTQAIKGAARRGR